MKDGTRKRIFFLFILAGLTVLNVPFFCQLADRGVQSSVIREYEKSLENLGEEERLAMLDAARVYNEELAASAKTAVPDAFSEEIASAGSSAADTFPGQAADYESLLNPDGSGVMGYLSIPQIQAELPVYHGTSADVLEQGAGHLEGTSLPVGGASVHAVISAHNGLTSKVLFTDLDQLVEGDRFYLYVLGERLAYEVDQILTVEPEETEALAIAEGEDYVTLVTCTPYGINSHRYLVRGRRTEWDGGESGFGTAGGKWKSRQLVFAVSMAALAASALILLKPAGTKRKEKQL